MIAEKKGFISLIPKKKDMEAAAMPTEMKDGPKGPCLYINDIKLPLPDDALDQEMRAEIEFKPKRISKSETNGKTSISYDLEITGIKLLPF